MEKKSASYSDFVGVVTATSYPPPLRLVRTFRSDFRPIPSFLQDLLAEAPCFSCPDNQSRIIDLLKHIQTSQDIDPGSQGKLWFEIRRILKKDLLADNNIYSDGRAIRDLLLTSVRNKTFLEPVSPIHLRINRLKFRAKKFEPLTTPLPSPSLSVQRQTSH